MSTVLKKDKILGYTAGIISGITYGMNPLFARPLMENGVSVDTMLLFRYLISVLLLGGWVLLTSESTSIARMFSINKKQAFRLIILGLLFGFSSLTLFSSYKYMPSGLATTIIYLYPVIVAMIMVMFRVYPTWQVWLSITLTFIGVVILCRTDGSIAFQWQGILLAGTSAMLYAIYLVIINRSTSLRTVPNNILTFYALLVGSSIFLIHHLISAFSFDLESINIEHSLFAGVTGLKVWTNLLGLALFPTIISLVCLAISARKIGPTKTSILGVFEPLTAIIIGTSLFDEPLTVNIIIGSSISIFAIIFMIATGPKGQK